MKPKELKEKIKKALWDEEMGYCNKCQIKWLGFGRCEKCEQQLDEYYDAYALDIIVTMVITEMRRENGRKGNN